MFFSHQLLARKAPLGQIWMAATMHAKLNRRNLNKLNLVKICEEILNPSVPMALRLSGILMGGVVIVYERKVKLLYDDVSRLLVEINEAWKVKPTSTDPTVLPRGKTQAKFEAVTLPYNDDTDAAGEVEQPLHNKGVQRGGFLLQLDDVEDAYININPGEDESTQQHHQADPANITLFGDVDSYVAETYLNNRFERFDIDGEGETNLNFTSHEYPEIPTTFMPSPPPPDAPPQDVGMQDHQPVEPEDPRKEYTNEVQEQEEQEMQRQPPLKRKAREKHPQIVMDIDQIIIPGAIYQAWLKDASDLVSDRGSRRRRFNLIRSSKISTLMEIPPVGLFSSENTSTEIHYPAPLMELWQKCTRTASNLDAASERISSARQPRQPSHSTSGEAYHQEPSDFPGEDFPSEMGSQTIQISIEKLRANLNNINIMTTEDVLMGDNIVTPGSPSLSAKSNPNSSSGHATLPMDPEVQLPSGRSKRRQNSSKHSTNSLDPVEEDAPWHESGRDPKLRKVSEYDLAPDLELLEETGPTQTPLPNLNPSIDKTTQSIRTHLKLHFDTPGNPQVESLDSLASGMNRRRAAMLFYQTCVLATCDYVKVEQSVPYGEIFLSKGPNM